MKYSAVQRSKRAISCVVFFLLVFPADISFFYAIRHLYMRVWPSEKLSLALVSRAYVRVSVKPAYIKQTTIREKECEGGMTGWLNCHLTYTEFPNWEIYQSKTSLVHILLLGIEDDDGNVGKTIKLITQDKKRTWICEIKLTFVPSCSRVRRQLLYFHAVFKIEGDAGVNGISAKEKYTRP